MQAPENELTSYEEKFLEWMHDSLAWLDIQSEWKHSKEGPWSLPLFLSRAYLRFKKTRAAHVAQRHSNAAPQGTLDESFVKELSGPILKTFFELTRDLPEQEQLSYILHLEGLIDVEIALLLNRDLAAVQADIVRAKEAVEAAARERNSAV
jgi:hypothetical protein